LTSVSKKIYSQRMSEQYELLIDDLRMQLNAEQQLLQKREEDLEERDEQINTLRTDYREAREANESLELNMEELKHQLERKTQQIRVLQKKKRSEIEKEVLVENEQLKEKLRILRERYNIILSEKNELKEAEYDCKEPSSPESIIKVSPPPDQMQELLEQMVAQYESEIHILRTANEETMTGLQRQLEEAIVDKEEIAESYILEIERLDLALTEAVNLLTDVQKKYHNLKAIVAPSEKGVRYRSLYGATIKSQKGDIILPPDTEVVCSKVIKRHSAQISRPIKYQGLVDLQTISGRWLFQAVEAVEFHEIDGSFQPRDTERSGIDDYKV